MKKSEIIYFLLFSLLFYTCFAYAEKEVKESSDKSFTSSITENARNVKTKTKKRIFDVLDISLKSIAAEKARLLYNEHEPTPEEIEEEEIRKAFFKSTKKLRPKYKGRPTKKEGRKLREILDK